MVEEVRVTVGSPPVSEIVIGRGVVGRPDARVILPVSAGRRRVAVMTQGAVAALAAEVAHATSSAGLETSTTTLPDRDDAKTLTVVEGLYSWLNDLHFTRHDTVVAVGGGAATDAAGFVAATYLRGIEAVFAPTTLLGAVDAAIGGKAALNVGGKNIVGAFKHPARVVVDLDVLDELPEALVREGAAEALKTGLIGDPAIVEAFETAGLDASLGDIVVRSIRVKADIVGRDFEEWGERAYLNYGHTVGHAIETLAGIPHGHAVAVGMVAAGAASERITGFRQAARQRGIISELGLPTGVEGIDPVEAMTAMKLDKKRDQHGLRMVLLASVGDPRVVVVDDATVRAALAAVGID